MVWQGGGKNASAKYCCNAARSVLWVVWDGYSNGVRREWWKLALEVPTNLDSASFHARGWGGKPVWLFLGPTTPLHNQSLHLSCDHKGSLPLGEYTAGWKKQYKYLISCCTGTAGVPEPEANFPVITYPASFKVLFRSSTSPSVWRILCCKDSCSDAGRRPLVYILPRSPPVKSVRCRGFREMGTASSVTVSTPTKPLAFPLPNTCLKTNRNLTISILMHKELLKKNYNKKLKDKGNIMTSYYFTCSAVIQPFKSTNWGRYQSGLHVCFWEKSTLVSPS